MADVTTRTLRNYLASLPSGVSSGVVDQQLEIRNDLAPATQALPIGGTTGQVLAKLSSTSFDVAWTTAGVGDMLKVTYDPTNINASPFVRANQTGTQPYTTITGLGDIVTHNVSEFATSAQGGRADTAVQPTNAQTLTNKRITPRVSSAASTAILTPDSDAFDVVALTAQAVNLTIAAPSGTPTDGQRLILRFRDNGTSRTVSWNAVYSAYSSDLPTATITSSTMVYDFIWNSGTSKWDLLSGNPVPGKWA